MLHALGVEHEQSRFDRDEYVQILFENVIDGKYGRIHFSCPSFVIAS